MAWLKTDSTRDIFIHLGVILLIGFLIALLFFYAVLPAITHHGESVRVPDLKGKSVEEIETILEKIDLRYNVSDSTYAAGVNPLTVISQNPLPNAEVKSNRQIYITICSKTPPKIAMPKLTDVELNAAIRDIRNNELVLGSINKVQGLFDNLVVNQYLNGKIIEPGTMIPKGSTITLDVGERIDADMQDSSQF